MGAYRKEYGKKITGILNEADILAALRFGATDTIGFVLEIDGGPGVTIGWHIVRCDNYDYEIQIQGEKKHYPWVTTILDSQQYVNVKTGKFTTATLGSLGIESYLGTAFIALNGAERDNAGSLILNGNNLPI